MADCNPARLQAQHEKTNPDCLTTAAQDQTRQAESEARQTGTTERNGPTTCDGQNTRNRTSQPKTKISQPTKHGRGGCCQQFADTDGYEIKATRRETKQSQPTT